MGVVTSGVYFYQKDKSEFQVPYLPFRLNLFFVCYYYKIRKWGEKTHKSLRVKRQKSKASQDTQYKQKFAFFMS